MKKIKESLAGRKTYIIAAGAILTAFGAWLGDAISTKELIESIFAALGAATLRAGVKKAEVMMLLGLLILPGCAIHQTDVLSIKTRVAGLNVSYQGTGIQFGFISSVIQKVPTGTNQLYSARHFENFTMDQSANPFNTSIVENSGFGDVQVWTNAQGGAVVPKGKVQ